MTARTSNTSTLHFFGHHFLHCFLFRFALHHASHVEHQPDQTLSYGVCPFILAHDVEKSLQPPTYPCVDSRFFPFPHFAELLKMQSHVLYQFCSPQLWAAHVGDATYKQLYRSLKCASFAKIRLVSYCAERYLRRNNNNFYFSRQNWGN